MSRVFIRILLVSIHKWSFCSISALCSKNNPRNIKYMPVVIFFTCLDLEQKSSIMDGHYIISKLYFRVFSSLGTAPSEINVRSKNVTLSDRSIKTTEDERVP